VWKGRPNPGGLFHFPMSFQGPENRSYTHPHMRKTLLTLLFASGWAFAEERATATGKGIDGQPL
jgi:hypothetical protein